MATLAVAVIDAFKSKNNNRNANNFFSTVTPTKNDLDPAAQIFARRVLQVRRTACKKEGAEDRFKHLLRDYANKHKKNGTWPKWYRHVNPEEVTEDEIFPNEQPHPSTKEHEEGWSDQITPLGPIGLLIESIVWHGMKIDENLRLWQHKEEPVDVIKVPYQNLKPLVLGAAARARNHAEWRRGASTKRARSPIEIDNDISQVAGALDEEEKRNNPNRHDGRKPSQKGDCSIQPRC